jgi:hypothetical protein
LYYNQEIMKRILFLVACVTVVGLTTSIAQTTTQTGSEPVPTVKATPASNNSHLQVTEVTETTTTKATTTSSNKKSKASKKMAKKGCCVQNGTYSKAKCGGMSKAECAANCKEHAHKKGKKGTRP